MRGEQQVKRGTSGWRWVRAHWLDLMLPALAFLLAGGIYRQVQWLREGRRTQQARRHYQAAVRAEGKGDRRAALDEARAAAQVTPDDPGMETSIATLLQSLTEPVPAAR